jgi:hypothetical protein
VQHTETVVVATPRNEVRAPVGDPDSWPVSAADVADVHVDGELRAGATASCSYRSRRTDVVVSAYSTAGC